MAVTVQSVSTGTLSSTSNTVTKPSGLAVGDLMVALLFKNHPSYLSFPSGWTNLVRQVAGQHQIRVVYKVADSGDVAASTFTFSAGSGDRIAVTLYRITDGVSSSIDQDSTSSNTVDLETVTANSLVIYAVLTDDGGSAAPVISNYAITNSPSFTQRFQQNFPSFTMAVADAYYAHTATIISATLTQSTSTDNLTKLLILIPEATNAAGTAALHDVSPTFFDIAATAGTGGTTALHEASPTFFEPNGTVRSETVWTEETKPSAPVWTEQIKP